MIFGLNKNKNQSPDNKAEKAAPSMVGKALRYSHLPGIIPRIRELALKFGHFAYMLALVYRAVNLLPANHPYVNAANIGRFGLRDVIASAANNVQMKRENIDQIAVFGAVLMSVVLIGAQVIIIALSTVMGQANAASFFSIPAADVPNDVVLVFLEQVFGDVGVFGTGAAGIGTPLHTGLHAMLSFYSMAMLVLAVFIIIYYIITVVGEAAISGTPFGRRFNSLWAPIRLVVALGLLVPVANGLNSAQYITLYTAKMGSNLATNAWNVFVDEMSTDASNLVAKPELVNMAGMIQAVFIAEVCRQSYDQINNASATVVPSIQYTTYLGSRVDQRFSLPMAGANIGNIYDSAVAGSGRNDYNRIKFSWVNSDTESDQCGALTVELVPLMVEDPSNPGNSIELPSSRAIHIAYMEAIVDAQNEIANAAALVVQSMQLNNSAIPGPFSAERANAMAILGTALGSAESKVNGAIGASYTSIISNPAVNAQLFTGLKDEGWGGAALYYMNLGEINQRYGQVTTNIPSFSSPYGGSLGNPDNESLFMNGFDGGADRTWVQRQTAFRDVAAELDRAGAIAIDVSNAFYEEESEAGLGDVADITFEMFLSALFNLNKLYEFKDVTAAGLDPMVGIMQIGDSMVNRAVTMFTLAAGAKMAAAISGAIPNRAARVIGAFADALGGIAFLLALIGFGAGLMLFYLLPLMPFIYFFFAIVSWILEIFEAMVAMPLWALAHLKIDGDGLPGPLAINGYFLLLGIILRPVLIVFGLIGGYIIFGAGAYLLAGTFDIAVDQVRGNDDVGALGRLIYAIIFVYLAYSLGMMCFKMVDAVPRGILRWIGQGGATPFSDEKPEDPFQGSKGMIFAAAGIASMARPGPARATFQGADGNSVFDGPSNKQNQTGGGR